MSSTTRGYLGKDRRRGRGSTDRTISRRRFLAGGTGVLATAAMLGRGWSRPALVRAAGEKTKPVKVESGLLVGEAQDGFDVFRGIPFAAPPVGNLRWKPPQVPKPWDGTREALQFGPISLQAEVFQPRSGQSEDCLFLNIWTPTGSAPASKRPVLFWIHSGGFVQNAGSDTRYYGDELARRGVVVVTINYRLGPLGFFAHPALTAEAAADAPLGNYGLMDQIAALQWVQRNIAAFGGDPANVSVSGSSAGAISIPFLMAIPAARGLFHKAIIQSGGALTADPAIKQYEEAGAKFAQSLGVDPASGAAGLRQLDADSLVVDPTKFGLPNRPFVDGRLLTGTLQSLFGEDKEAPVPLLIGAASGESGGREFGDDISLGGMFAPQVQLADALVRTGTPVYTFHFTFVPPALRSLKKAPVHGEIIPYAFGTLEARGSINKITQLSNADYAEGELPVRDPKVLITDEVRAMSDTMLKYWVAFMQTGQPKVDGLPAWPAYATTTRQAMVFGNFGIGPKVIPAARVQPAPTPVPPTPVPIQPAQLPRTGGAASAETLVGLGAAAAGLGFAVRRWGARKSGPTAGGPPAGGPGR